MNERWSLIGFLGTGRAWGNGVAFADAEKPVSGGAGFRYLLARRLGLRVGLDVAKSTVDSAVYVVVGNAWR